MIEADGDIFLPCFMSEDPVPQSLLRQDSREHSRSQHFPADSVLFVVIKGADLLDIIVSPDRTASEVPVICVQYISSVALSRASHIVLMKKICFPQI